MKSFKKRVSRKLSKQVSLLSDDGTSPKMSKTRMSVPKAFDNTPFLPILPKIVEDEDCDENHLHHRHASILEPDSAIVVG